jgi:hypothetical protein
MNNRSTLLRLRVQLLEFQNGFSIVIVIMNLLRRLFFVFIIFSIDMNALTGKEYAWSVATFHLCFPSFINAFPVGNSYQ